MAFNDPAYSEVIRKAQSGDHAVLPQLRRYFDQNPNRSKLCWGDISDFAKLQFLNNAAGTRDLVLREAMLRELTNLAQELAGPAPSPLEALLADRAALDHAVLAYYEVLYQIGLKQGLTPQQDALHQRRITQAHRRYLASLKTLAQVRRLQLPALQINLAKNQQVQQLNQS